MEARAWAPEHLCSRQALLVKRVALTTDAQSIAKFRQRVCAKGDWLQFLWQQSIQLEYHRLTITNIKQQLESDQNQQTRNLTWAKNKFKQVQGFREQVPNQKERQRPERLWIKSKRVSELSGAGQLTSFNFTCLNRYQGHEKSSEKSQTTGLRAGKWVIIDKCFRKCACMKNDEDYFLVQTRGGLP